MAKFDHLTLPVANWVRSRQWYVQYIGLKMEFEASEQRTVALQDSAGFTIFFEEMKLGAPPAGVALYFSVTDVEATYGELSAAGLAISHAPARVFWGYGMELRDPDGYLVRLWDERTMKERSAT
jgi:predicted enzyme related to lactoylglutathione lyase